MQAVPCCDEVKREISMRDFRDDPQFADWIESRLDDPPDNSVARKRDDRLVNEIGCRKRVAAVQVVTRGDHDDEFRVREDTRVQLFLRRDEVAETDIEGPSEARKPEVALRMHVEQDRSRRLTGREHASDGGSDDGSRVA